MEPGGAASLAVRVQAAGLPKLHSSHGDKQGLRWMWVELPLPKFSGAGVKKARLLNRQKGLSVACAVVSASRRGAPTDADLKELTEAAGRTIAEAARLDLEIADTTPSKLAWDTLQAGKPVYGDRDYSFTSLPQGFEGLKYLRTEMDEKLSTAAFSITFRMNQAVTVYVAHHDRLQTKPAWLSDFANTGLVIRNEAGHFNLYSRDFAGGAVTLGGNTASGENVKQSMYFVIVRPCGKIPAVQRRY